MRFQELNPRHSSSMMSMCIPLRALLLQWLLPLVLGESIPFLHSILTINWASLTMRTIMTMTLGLFRMACQKTMWNQDLPLFIVFTLLCQGPATFGRPWGSVPSPSWRGADVHPWRWWDLTLPKFKHIWDVSLSCLRWCQLMSIWFLWDVINHSFKLFQTNLWDANAEEAIPTSPVDLTASPEKDLLCRYQYCSLSGYGFNMV